MNAKALRSVLERLLDAMADARDAADAAIKDHGSAKDALGSKQPSMEYALDRLHIVEEQARALLGESDA